MRRQHPELRKVANCLNHSREDHSLQLWSSLAKVMGFSFEISLTKSSHSGHRSFILPG